MIILFEISKFLALTRRLLLFFIFPLILSQDRFLYKRICVILCAMFRIIFFPSTKKVGGPGLAEELGGPKCFGGPPTPLRTQQRFLIYPQRYTVPIFSLFLPFLAEEIDF